MGKNSKKQIDEFVSFPTSAFRIPTSGILQKLNKYNTVSN